MSASVCSNPSKVSLKAIPDDVIRQRRARLAHHPDVVAARSRIRDIAGSWDVTLKGPLRGFDCISLGPTEFREQLKRNFSILLNARELGALVAWYVIYCSMCLGLEHKP